MKTTTTSKVILMMQLFLIITMIQLKSSAQSTIPDFLLLDESEVSISKGYHDGAGCVDIDNDGDQDMIITNTTSNSKPNLMYRNERNNRFVQIRNTEYTTQNVYFGLAGPFGDIDNDGDEDLLLVSWQGTSYIVYQNDGFGNFSAINTLSKKVNATAVLLDMDGDGFLDLVELNSAEGKIHLNDGQGQFTSSVDISIVAPTPTAQLMTVAFGDADNDRDLDLYYPYCWDNYNNFARNRFYLNNGMGNLIKEPDTSVIVSEAAITMSVNWVDYDNDNDMDLYVLESGVYGASVNYTGIMYENKGGLLFEKQFIEPNPYYNTHKTSSMWGDLDNDGDQDLLVSVDRNNFYDHTTPLKHSLLFQNNGDGSFTEISDCAVVDSGAHSSILEDFDNDGDLDVLNVSFGFAANGVNYLYENEGNDNSWIVLTCKGTSSSSSAYGTRINAIATINGERVIQTREIVPTSGHNSNYPSSRIHFGLGDAETVDTLLIRWPLGHVDTFVNVQANHLYRAIEGSVLEMDLTASNYISYEPYLQDTALYAGENLTFDLAGHYKFVGGDSVPVIEGDTLTYSLAGNSNADAVIASVENGVLQLIPGTAYGVSTISVLVSAGFIQRMDAIQVEYKSLLSTSNISNDPLFIYPNPVSDILNIECPGYQQGNLKAEITDAGGRLVWSGTIEEPVASINLSAVANGFYFLKVYNRDYCQVNKIVKE
jgi:hypothetical protein